MATITVTIPDTIMIGRNGVHGSLQVDWEKVPQHVKDHIAAVHFPQYFSDSFNSGGKEATSADRLALAEKKYAQMLAGEIRTRGASLEPVDPVEKEAYSEARKALAAYFVKEGFWKDIPKGTTNRFEYVLNRAQKAIGDPEMTDVDYIAWFLDETDVGKQIRIDAKVTVEKRNRLAAGLPSLVKRADVKPVATKRGKAA
jgi:hypothetical protein